MKTTGRGQRFLTNVLWIWTGFAVSFVAALVLPRYVVSHLGEDGYGLWSLVFSFVGYYSLLDLGLRSAVIRYTAEYKATGDMDAIHRLYSTMLVLFSGIAAVLGVGIFFAKDWIARTFVHAPDRFQGDVPALVLATAVGTAIGLPGTVLSGVLEGYQRFDLSGRVSMIAMGLRYAGLMAALWLGYGVLAMGMWVAVSITIHVALFFWAVRRLDPQPRFSSRFLDTEILKRTFHYGFFTFKAGMAARVLEGASPVIIGYHWPVSAVGFFNFPSRLLSYVAEPLSRVGSAVQPQVAELIAQDNRRGVAEIGIYVNRYCYALFMPFAVFLLVYGGSLLRVWMGPVFETNCQPLLVWFAISTAVAVAGQFSSSSILFGLARHDRYAWGQVVEAALLVAGTLWASPRYGIAGAAWVLAGLMFVVRGLFTPWLVCQAVGYSYIRYMQSIYFKATLAAIPVFAVLHFLKPALPGNNWPQLIIAGVVASVVYFAEAYFLCLEPRHQQVVRETAGRFLPFLRPGVAA